MPKNDTLDALGDAMTTILTTILTTNLENQYDNQSWQPILTINQNMPNISPKYAKDVG